MPHLFDRLRIVARLPRRSRDAAWSAALPHADADELEALSAEILDALVDEPASDLALDLLRRWPDLSTLAQQTMVSVVGPRLPGLLDRLVESDPRLAWRAAGDLLGVRGGAELRSALVAWAGEHARLAGPMDTLARSGLAAAAAAARTPQDRLALDAALAAGASRYADHRDAGLLEAVAGSLASPGPSLARWLDEADHADLLPLRSAIRRRLNDDGADLAMGLLARGGLDAPVTEWLERGAGPEAWPRLLERAHLLAAPGRTRALRRRPGLTGRLRVVAATPGLSARAQRGLARWIGASGGDPSARASTLGELIALPDAGARLAAVRTLAACPASRAADEALLELALDDDPRVATASAGALTATPSAVRLRSNEAAVALLRRSPVEAVRALADAADERLARSREAGDPASIRSFATARAALVRDRLGCVCALSELIEAGAPGPRVMALDFVRRHGLAVEVDADALLAAARDGDAHIAARAVRLLGMIDSPAARAELTAALEHPNRRVAAGAVEALTRRDDAPDLAAMATDPTPRVRANAVRAMLDRDRPAGREALGAMLGDERADHRISGLWAAQRGRAIELVERVGALATRDPDARVRRRALRCATRLLARPGRGRPFRPAGETVMRRAS